jgi:hypothetical protein
VDFQLICQVLLPWIKVDRAAVEKTDDSHGNWLNDGGERMLFFTLTWSTLYVLQ